MRDTALTRNSPNIPFPTHKGFELCGLVGLWKVAFDRI